MDNYSLSYEIANAAVRNMSIPFEQLPKVYNLDQIALVIQELLDQHKPEQVTPYEVNDSAMFDKGKY